MLFNSEEFLLFFPIVLVLYYLLPARVRYIWLLLASYYFYMCWNAKYVLLILATTVITYTCGLLLSMLKMPKSKKGVLAFCVVGTLGMLFFFKYLNFAGSILRRVLMPLHISLNTPSFDILLPVGISFYTFQSLGYVIDVYRGQLEPERNFLKYALFVSFFPQLVAGPIERSQNLLGQLSASSKLRMENLKNGFMLMLWGYFLKIVIADRAGIFVDVVYGDCHTYFGWYIVVATTLFAIQIYCDFYGYSVIAMGAAKMLGIDLTENFDAPYLSGSIADFWRRWHISLTSWFRDYLYIPLGGGQNGKYKKYLNTMIVFLLSGLWHGARISFVVWGAINGIYQIAGDFLKPIKDRLNIKLHMDRSTFSHKLLQSAVVFVLVDFSWIFFRAEGIQHAFSVIKAMFSVNNPWVLFDGSLYQCGLDSKNFILLLLSIAILVTADYMKCKGISIRACISRQDPWFRCAFVAVSIWLILILEYGDRNMRRRTLSIFSFSAEASV